MRGKTIGILLLAVAMLAVWALPAGAIAKGEQSDDDRVGALFISLFIPESLGGPFQTPWMAGCSGSQASETVFLTAGHCLAGTAAIPPEIEVSWGVSFADQAFDPAHPDWIAIGPVIEATGAVWDPGFGHDWGNLKDYGVVLFEEEPLPGPYVDLPYLGQLDDMKRNHELKGLLFDRVGYGVQPEHKQGPPRFFSDGYRYETQSPYLALNQNWLHLNENNDATGLGGGCFGDSGSPILWENTAFAVTTGGDPVCRAWGINQRLDTPDAQAFLGQFLTLPTP